MNKQSTRVYDLPTRIFHWLLAISFASAFFIAKTFEDESPLFPIHMLLGLTMCFLVILRLIWSLVGSQYARLSSFRLNPKELKDYFLSMLQTNTKRYLSHNPASSYAAVAMFIFTIGLGVTGVLMSQDINKHLFEDIHEILANLFIITVLLHIAGVIFHHMRHKDGMAMSMITGTKHSIEGKQGIQTNHAGAAMVFVGLVGLFVFYLGSNYDPTKQQLDVFGAQVQLGEAKEAKDDDSTDGQKSSKSRDDDDEQHDRNDD